VTPKSSRRAFLTSAACAASLPAAGRAAAAEERARPLAPPRKRVLGRTGLSVTELGMGCEAVSDVSVLRRALDLGINFFDTARSYQAGNNERFLREALGTRRKEVVLSTRSYAEDARTLAAELDASLVALGVPQVDIWYLGNRNTPAAVTDEMLDVQRRAQQAGKIRFRGFSTHALRVTLDLILNRGRFDVVQVPYNFAIGTRRDPLKLEGTPGRMERLRRTVLGWSDPTLEECITRLADAGVGVVAMKVMAGGYRGRTPKDPLYGTFQQPGAHGAALRWALRDARVRTTSVRMLDDAQLDENLRAVATAYSPDDEKRLAERAAAIAPRYCRMCGGCEGACRYGLDVATLVRSVSYVDGYGAFEMGAERWAGLAPPQRDVRCGECASCSVSCPNGVRVREQLLRARSLFA
jgi:predicted aldo/keto reductase-like oxidoreductase